MMRVSILACGAAAVILAGCGAQKPVTRSIPGVFRGDKLVELPRGYGIKCAAAMQARRSGSGDGASMLVNPGGGVQLVTAALTFSDAGAAERAYAASTSAETRRCYADGFVAELVRRYDVRVRRVRTEPRPVGSQIGGERSGTRVSVVIAAGRRDVVVSADSAVIRIGSVLSINQVIDVTALGRAARAPDLRLVEALS